MGRWTPLILMAGGLAILLGTLLGINFPMGGQQTASNDAADGKTSKVLPANINVNSSAPSQSTSNETSPENRGGVAQESFSTSESSGNSGSVAQESFSTPNNTTSVAQSNDSSSSGGTTTGTRSTGFQSGTTTTSSSTASSSSQERRAIRALW
ncbi:hypothetical protein [Nodularia sp. NIES-3585]|uniref:hypothetical protein n=1 Tax=Nodularia sp. NIES-3585 TaxID=1973477 RepID=UPI000B5C4EB6|nr:hypothetical protein [Nodularia sp. NIES-3585]GAX36608.1 hypothetical protein NIES3585_26430 [Nodularia sp. NIES-3585]